MNKYAGKIIDLYTKSQVEEPARGAFHNWMVDDDSFFEKEEALIRLWNNSDNVATKDTVNSLFSLQSKHQLSKTGKEKRVLSFLRYAAAIALIVVISSVILFVKKGNPSENNIKEFFSEPGKTEFITLPDGSIIQTNSGSVILYSDAFGVKTRTVYLSGEANFKVRKNTKVPFIVKSKDFSVTALGTEFNVSSYPNDSYFSTTLIDGSVKVQQNDKSKGVILKENEQFVYEKKSKQITISDVDISEATAWQQGELVFRGAGIRDILNVLERKFGISFQYNSNQLNDDKYNLRFKKNATLSDIMDILIEVADDFNFKQVDDLYNISSKEMD